MMVLGICLLIIAAIAPKLAVLWAVGSSCWSSA